MGKIKAIYIRQSPRSIEHILLDIDERNSNRPAWLRVNVRNQDGRYICYDGENGSRTYYELKFDGIYTPIDATAEEILAMYNHIASVYDNITPDNAVLAKFIRQKVGEHCRVGVTALDIFAGTGLVAAEIADYCSRIDLVDSSENMLEQARNRDQLANATFVVSDVTQIEFERDYELVACSNGFQYLNGSQIEHVVRKLHDAQPKRGLFVNVGRINIDVVGRYYDLIESGIVKGLPVVDLDIERKPSHRYLIGIKK